MNISNDYINMFINSDPLMLNALPKEKKAHLLKAANLVFDDIIKDYEKNNRVDLKIKYLNLINKFKEVFPEQSEILASIDKKGQSTLSKYKIFNTAQKKDEFNSLLKKASEHFETPTIFKLVLEAIMPEQNPLIKSILDYVKLNPGLFEEDPTLATKGHQLLHELAQKEIAAGNFQSAFKIESNAAIVFTPSAEHPLYHMDEVIKHGSVVKNNLDMGVNFNSYDTSIVKGGLLHSTQRTIDGYLTNCFDFKITPYAREELTKHLDAITNHFDEFKSSLPEGLCSNVKIYQDVPHLYKYYNKDLNQFTTFEGYNPSVGFSKKATATEILFEGVGKIIIGNTPEVGCMYNWIQVELSANQASGEGAKKLHQILAMSGLGAVLGSQPVESDERMQIAQLFRAFYPSACSAMDTKKEFYQLPLDELKKKIILVEPGMQPIFKKYLEDSPELMLKVEIAPGRKVWGVADLGTQMKAAGAWGLMSGIGNSGNWNSTKETIARILSQGSLASEQRFQAGLIKSGVSSENDLCNGGGDQIFTRLVNNNTGRYAIKSFPFFGEAQILWNLETTAQRVPYGFDRDSFGVRNRSSFIYSRYEKRPSLIELSKNVINPANEIMLKNMADPSHISGFVVPTESQKNDLISHLKKNNLAIESPEGRILIIINDRKVDADKFIHVGKQFNKEWW